MNSTTIFFGRLMNQSMKFKHTAIILNFCVKLTVKYLSDFLTDFDNLILLFLQADERKQPIANFFVALAPGRNMKIRQTLRKMNFF